MAVETERRWERPGAEARRRTRIPSVFASVGRALNWLAAHGFTSLTRRIIVLNLIALAGLLLGTLYLNQFRAGLIDAKVQSLQIQGEIIAGAIAAAAAVNTDSVAIEPERLFELDAGDNLSPEDDELGSLEFPINPELAAPILRRLIQPTGTRARIYDRDGVLTLDSRNLYSRGQILRYDLPPPDQPREGVFRNAWSTAKSWFRRRDLPPYRELGDQNGKGYPEVAAALSGTTTPIVRVNDQGEIIVSVAVPVQRLRAVLGALLLQTKGGDIDQIVEAEQLAIVRTFAIAMAVMIVLSIALAGTIAGPMRRLSEAATRVRLSAKGREQIPDFTDRGDEIGQLSGALRDMTQALYRRLDAIESFAADVAHELKNPLTALRSAAEALRTSRDRKTHDKMFEIIHKEARRLDQLISDISDASRLDAELAREEAEPVDLEELLRTIVIAYNDIWDEGSVVTDLSVKSVPNKLRPYIINGYDSRIGQVVSNLLENARSFSPKGGTIRILLQRVGDEIEVAIEDEGPGIPPDNLERIFERFYSYRPGQAEQGKNSGLGLNISRQIIDAHAGRIWAENRLSEDGDGRKDANQKISGARFLIRLPAA